MNSERFFIYISYLKKNRHLILFMEIVNQPYHHFIVNLSKVEDF